MMIIDFLFFMLMTTRLNEALGNEKDDVQGSQIQQTPSEDAIPHELSQKISKRIERIMPESHSIVFVNPQMGDRWRRNLEEKNNNDKRNPL